MCHLIAIIVNMFLDLFLIFLIYVHTQLKISVADRMKNFKKIVDSHQFLNGSQFYRYKNGNLHVLVKPPSPSKSIALLPYA